jgi:transcriptional regulator GlxA family with amidase domain
MERARWMLNEPDATVASVAGALGFTDLAHFRRVFRRQFNASPRGGP